MATADLAWMSQGGILVDGTGDIALDASPYDCYATMVRTRLKAALNGWKLYPGIGAGLNESLGRANSNENEVALRKAAMSSLTNNFLASGSFTVTSLAISDQISVFVYINQTLIATATVSSSSDTVQVS